MAAPIRLGPFQLTSPIGRGGMGTVWGGVHLQSQLPAAVKVLALERVAEERDQFRTEARAVAGLNHPSVVWILDFGEVDLGAARAWSVRLALRAPFLVMERADATLATVRRRATPWGVLKPVVTRVLDALAHAYVRGVIHRDLKPANVLLVGVRPGPKLSDFGLAQLEASAHRDGREGRPGGTPGYMAPRSLVGRGATLARGQTWTPWGRWCGRWSAETDRSSAPAGVS